MLVGKEVKLLVKVNRNYINTLDSFFLNVQYSSFRYECKEGELTKREIGGN